jgi:hypothetical protein
MDESISLGWTSYTTATLTVASPAAAGSTSYTARCPGRIREEPYRLTANIIYLLHRKPYH